MPKGFCEDLPAEVTSCAAHFFSVVPGYTYSGFFGPKRCKGPSLRVQSGWKAQDLRISGACTKRYSLHRSPWDFSVVTAAMPLVFLSGQLRLVQIRKLTRRDNHNGINR